MMNKIHAMLDTTAIAGASLPYIAELNDIGTLLASLVAIVCGCISLYGYAARFVKNAVVPFVKSIIAKIKNGDIHGAADDIREAIDNAVEEVRKNDPDRMD
jgi:hypothetical protein